MRRQMLVINVVLAVVAVGLAGKLRGDWRRANQRYGALAVTARPAPAAPALASGTAAGGGDLEVIVAGNLFAPDRNNELPKPAERKVVPPEPLLVGTLNLGRGKVALLAEATAAGTMPRQVKEGETFAGYKLVSIDDQQVTLEYEGQQKKVDVSTAARQVSAPAAAAPRAATEPQVISTKAASGPSATSPSTTTVPSSSTGVGPTGALIPGTTSMYGYRDNLPAGTVIGNRRKVVRKTPFGEQVFWELIQPEGKKPDEKNP